MKRNKIVAWLLCVVMMIGIMAGCGEGDTKETEKPKETGNAVETEKQQETEKPEETEAVSNFNEEGYPIVNEEITLKVMLGVRDVDPMADPEEIPALQRLEELTGINVEWQIVKQAEWGLGKGTEDASQKQHPKEPKEQKRRNGRENIHGRDGERSGNGFGGNLRAHEGNDENKGVMAEMVDHGSQKAFRANRQIA